jgi:ferredoxin
MSNVDMMRIVVDFDACAATGGCVHQAPEVFSLGDDGMLRILQESPDESVRVAVLRAEELCPTGAITVED